jgi:hypothetical protein
MLSVLILPREFDRRWFPAELIQASAVRMIDGELLDRSVPAAMPPIHSHAAEGFDRGYFHDFSYPPEGL